MSEEEVVIVTGASGNLGAALCGVLARRGCRVVAVARNAEAVRARLSLPPALIIPAADLAEPADAAAAVARTMAAMGRIDGLAHTVGGFAIARTDEAGPDLWARMQRINLLTTLNMLRAVLPHMRDVGHGSVVAIGAAPALRAPAGFAAYAASKAAVLRLIESVAEEEKPHGIRANAVLPGIIDTPENRAAMPQADPRRWATPREVAEVIAFLLSNAASGVTGAAIPVAGRS
jgi:NAD(P)-dependent dehydrogenase (short-subunit alcohol dehydrogenase family)